MQVVQCAFTPEFVRVVMCLESFARANKCVVPVDSSAPALYHFNFLESSPVG